MDYNFLVTPEDPLPTIGVPEGPPKRLGDFTPRMFVKDVGKAYKELGGLQWLIVQATAAPAEFMKLLQKMMPKTVDLDLMEGTTITLIDQYSGKAVEIAGASRRAGGSPQGRQLPLTSPGGPRHPAEGQTATSGNPKLDVPGPPEIIDTYATEVKDAKSDDTL